ncbi:MAG TPA: hypothetical protein VEU96_23320 [Bryobacteraceae bacterium]|nr:hypothetical protein [Bryobacteraceae bacterium]
MKNPLFLVYGVMMIGLSSFAHYRGWSFSRINEQKISPKSIRDNPGAYRPTYGGYSRYVGGK